MTFVITGLLVLILIALIKINHTLETGLNDVAYRIRR